ncbi:putative 37S ribosomal protein S18, mitochondrial [Mycena kentingensis (nom. inval.)]|nr:putative 37S ribosomal protein S18, mitochondrial [Mycena kentingensis (nom. inval.)]
MADLISGLEYGPEDQGEDYEGHQGEEGMEEEQYQEEDRQGSGWLYGTHNPGDTIPAHRFHCHSTRNNTVNTFTDPNGATIAWFSGGSCGFRKRNRSTYESGYQCAVRMFEKISATAKAQPDRPVTVELFLKGFGQGRDALLKALATAQGEDVRQRIVSITDRTPLKIGGTRARKKKRR